MDASVGEVGGSGLRDRGRVAASGPLACPEPAIGTIAATGRTVAGTRVRNRQPGRSRLRGGRSRARGGRSGGGQAILSVRLGFGRSSKPRRVVE